MLVLLVHRIRSSTSALSTRSNPPNTINLKIRRILILYRLWVDLRFLDPWANATEAAMKPFGLLRLAVVSCGLCALFCFPSTCKAQSEVSPDHFDGTDSWESAAHKAHPAKPAQVRTVSLSNLKKPGTAATMQLAATREFSTPARHDAVAVEDKRKSAVHKPNKK